MSDRPPWWRPDRFAVRRPYLETRAKIVKATRAHFHALDFTEVETPALQISPGLEPHLVAFKTELKEPGALEGRPLYLHTSPEFSMKKLLAAGMEKIFQLARVQRNAERSATHHPEFTMLEWYRANDGYETLMRDCESLLWTTASAARVTSLKWQGRFCDPHLPTERITVADAFSRHAGIDILSTAPNPHAPSLDLLTAAAAPTGIAPRDGDRWDDLFFRIFLERIEPKLGVERATILYDYPISMAALSRPKESDPRLCERFELYICGLEVANAFGELTDAEVQRQRFNADMDLKQKLYNERYPIDEDLLAALAHGLPPTAGIALGFDRLVMLATGANHIEDVLWAPVVSPEENRPQGE